MTNSNDDFLLADVLKKNTIDFIKACISVLDIDKEDKLKGLRKKDDVVSVASQLMLKNVAAVLDKLPYMDLDILAGCIKEKQSELVFPAHPYVLIIYRLGLAKIEASKAGYKLVFPADFLKAVAAKAAKAIKNENNNVRFQVENIVLGALNIYGVVKDRQVLVNLISEFFEINVDEADALLASVRANSVLFHFLNPEPGLWYSPFAVDDLDGLKQQIEQCGADGNYKPVSRESCMKAYDCYCPIVCKEMEDLSLYLKSVVGVTDDTLLAHIWMSFNYNELDAEQAFGYIKDVYTIPEDQIAELRRKVDAFYDNLPLWAYCGQSLADVRRLNEPANNSVSLDGLTSGSSLANKFVDICKQVNPAIAPTQLAKKVGRNDPCPCGSGKKYKQCCGR